MKLIPLVPALLSLGGYVATLHTDVGRGDAAELALQAHLLGVTHPPGYPLHSFLGKLFGLAFSDPAIATNVLSALCTAAVVGLLCEILLTLTRNAFASVLASLIFAFAPAVWNAAVTTEVYNVNVCVLALALRVAFVGGGASSWRMPLAAGTLFGLSLGSGLANLLLLPGFVWLLRARAECKSNLLVPFIAALLIAGGAMLSWSFVRSATHPPLGSDSVPNNPGDFLLYITGAQFSTFVLQPGGFYLARATEHALYWGHSFLWLGAALGAWGAWLHWRRDRSTFAALALMFALNLGYFTCYPWTDYQDMVTPSYLLFSIWIAFGADALGPMCATMFSPARRSHSSDRAIRSVSNAGRLVAAAVPIALAAGLFVAGAKHHLRERQDKSVSEFVRASLEIFPRDALVVAHWYEFAPLLFVQRTQRLRLDVTLIERNDQPRHYTWGSVPDWRRYARDAVASRPVIVDAPDPVLAESCEFEPLSDQWLRLHCADKR